MSPEIVNRNNYSFGADIWALGVVLYKMICGVFPFKGNDDKELYKKINKGKPDYLNLSPNLTNLFSSIFESD